MDSMIGACIQTIKAINIIINGLQKTPDLVEDIRLESAQLGLMLEALCRTSGIDTLSDADIKGWIEQQRTCNATLRKIEDILEDYARGSIAKVPILRDLRFMFRLKEELSRLREGLKNYVQNFSSFLNVVRPDTKSGQPPKQYLRSSMKQEPVMSIDQFVRMQAGSDQVDSQRSELSISILAGL